MTDTVQLMRDTLSLELAEGAVAHTSAGGLSFFVGTTRDSFEGKRVMSLEYEAYDEMALKQMNMLCRKAREKWPDIVNIAIYHRLGRVPIGEASVLIAVSSPHRRQSIDACSSLIDNLKASVPIWKKEVYEDGSVWKANSEAFQQQT